MDIIHFIFEEDNSYSSSEEAEAKSAFRVSLYSMLYGQTYKYVIKSDRKNSASNSQFNGLNVEDAENFGVTPVNPANQAPKPYIPPTKVDANSATPFGEALGGGLN